MTLDKALSSSRASGFVALVCYLESVWDEETNAEARLDEHGRHRTWMGLPWLD